MKQNRGSPKWLIVGALLAILAGLLMFTGCGTANADTPTLSGEVRVGAATPTALDFGSGESVFGVEGVAKVAHLIGPLSISVACRHFFAGDKFAMGKSRLKLNGDVDIGSGASLFVEFERAYRVDSEWGWAGIRHRF